MRGYVEVLRAGFSADAQRVIRPSESSDSRPRLEGSIVRPAAVALVTGSGLGLRAGVGLCARSRPVGKVRRLLERYGDTCETQGRQFEPESRTGAARASESTLVREVEGVTLPCRRL